MANDQFYCEKCNRTMSEDNFYKSNNIEKYPDGKLKQCKKCITMHVDNWNPDTYMWILQEADVPYVPDEWSKLMLKYAQDKSKVTGATIISWAMDTLLQYNGFVCSFRDKDRLDLLKCKLVITIPEENYTMFVKDFLSTFNGYVEKVSW